MTRSLYLGLILAVCATGSLAVAADVPSSRLAVLDVEITGDLGGPELAAEHEARLKLANIKLRATLERTNLYRLVDTAPAQDMIDELKSRYRHLHDCNGCDLDIGRQLEADQVLVVWVNRVSGLILSITHEIHDVTTGQIFARKSFDFRGDNDAAWMRAIDYMVRDLKDSLEAAAHAASTPARLTLGEESIEELIEVPDDLALGRYKIMCEGAVLPTGEAGRFYCYSDDVPPQLFKATGRAVREAKFIPATMNGTKLGVFMSLMVIIQITPDKDDPLVLAVPNNGADADRYGLFYTAPQRYNSFSWQPDRFLAPLREDLSVYMNANVDEHGKITQHSVTNLSGATPQISAMLGRRIEDMKFIPGYFRRKPAPMLYAELMLSGAYKPNSSSLQRIQR